MIGYHGYLRPRELESATLEWLRRIRDPEKCNDFMSNSDARSIYQTEFQELVQQSFFGYFKALSCGSVINQTNYTIATNCASTVGSSGSPYFLLKQPENGVIGMHLGGGLPKHEKYANRTLAVSVNHPQFVAKWAKESLPLLTDSDKVKVEPYIQKHYDIISKLN